MARSKEAYKAMDAYNAAYDAGEVDWNGAAMGYAGHSDAEVIAAATEGVANRDTDPDAIDARLERRWEGYQQAAAARAASLTRA